MADTGWLDCGTVEFEPDIFADWSNPTDAQSEDGNSASSTMSALSITDILRGYNLSESIPAGSTIDGIEVRIKWSGDGTYVKLQSLNLHKSAASAGDDKSDLVVLPGSNTWSSTYGGPTDMWSTGYGYDDVTDSGFGLELWLYNNDSGSGQTGNIDAMQIKIYYTEGITHAPLPPHFRIP